MHLYEKMLKWWISQKLLVYDVKVSIYMYYWHPYVKHIYPKSFNKLEENNPRHMINITLLLLTCKLRPIQLPTNWSISSLNNSDFSALYKSIVKGT